jgi:molecular chaperone DnaK (HSP70)
MASHHTLTPRHTGEDFDQRVMEYFIKLIKKKYKVSVRGE